METILGPVQVILEHRRHWKVAAVTVNLGRGLSVVASPPFPMSSSVFCGTHRAPPSRSRTGP